MIRTTKRNKCALIHAHFEIPSGLIAIITSKILRKQVIITTPGSDINLFPKKSSIAIVLTKVALKKADKIIAVSKDLKRKICKDFNINPTKKEIISMGVRTDFFQPQDKLKAREILDASQSQNRAVCRKYCRS